MLSLSPSSLFHAESILKTVSRAPLLPLVTAQTPRNLSALPPAIRALPVDLQIVALCDMLADARQQIECLRICVAMEQDEHLATLSTR